MYTLLNMQCSKLSKILPPQLSWRAKAKQEQACACYRTCPRAFFLLGMMLGCTTVWKKLCGAFQKMKETHLQAFCILKCLASVFFFCGKYHWKKWKKQLLIFTLFDTLSHRHYWNGACLGSASCKALTSNACSLGRYLHIDRFVMFTWEGDLVCVQPHFSEYMSIRSLWI